MAANIVFRRGGQKVSYGIPERIWRCRSLLKSKRTWSISSASCEAVAHRRLATANLLKSLNISCHCIDNNFFSDSNIMDGRRYLPLRVCQMSRCRIQRSAPACWRTDEPLAPARLLPALFCSAIISAREKNFACKWNIPRTLDSVKVLLWMHYESKRNPSHIYTFPRLRGKYEGEIWL